MNWNELDHQLRINPEQISTPDLIELARATAERLIEPAAARGHLDVLGAVLALDRTAWTLSGSGPEPGIEVPSSDVDYQQGLELVELSTDHAIERLRNPNIAGDLTPAQILATRLDLCEASRLVVEARS